MAELVALVLLGSLVVYALTGGADFGGGVWDLFARGPRKTAQRDLVEHALAPIWEANHVWLILIVVVMFAALPTAFAAFMTALHVPLVLVLIGIVLRGAAFVFRTYDPVVAPDRPDQAGRRRWRVVFAVASAVSPFALGVCLGAVVSGGVRVDAHGAPLTDFISAWAAPFPMLVGLFVLVLVSWLAAVYLTVEARAAGDEALADDFRRRALAAGVLAGALGLTVLVVGRTSASAVARTLLDGGGLGAALQVVVALVGLAALQAVHTRAYRRARALAVLQVALVVIGLGVAQYPYILPPDLTFEAALAPRSVVEAILIALGVGGPILLAALIWLYRVFKKARP